MTMIVGRRYRAHLTDDQAQRAAQWLGAQRVVWNLAIEQRETVYRTFGESVGRFDQDRQLKDLRAEVEWIKDVPQVALQQVIRDVDTAYRNWWKGSHRKPRFRNRYSQAGVRVPGKEAGDPVKLNRRWAEIRFPKLGAIRYRRNQPISGRIMAVTLKRDRVGDWWLTMQVDTGAEPAKYRPGPTIGVDRGVAISAAVSDGRRYHAPRATDRESERRRRLERALARQQKGSNRRESTRRRLAKHRRREADRRRTWAHITSAELVANGGVVGFEDLNVKTMTASASGTIENPGSNVAQKRGLNRSILENGWGDLVRFTEYKAIRDGAVVVSVPAAYTSQRCSQCGQMGERENQASFNCPHCGFSGNADDNAAANIETAAGRAVSGRGDLQPLGGSVKRQLTPVVVS